MLYDKVLGFMAQCSIIGRETRKITEHNLLADKREDVSLKFNTSSYAK